MIVLVIVHFINNWFMMILVAVYVYLKINAMKSQSVWTIETESCVPNHSLINPLVHPRTFKPAVFLRNVTELHLSEPETDLKLFLVQFFRKN